MYSNPCSKYELERSEQELSLFKNGQWNQVCQHKDGTEMKKLKDYQNPSNNIEHSEFFNLLEEMFKYEQEKRITLGKYSSNQLFVIKKKMISFILKKKI